MTAALVIWNAAPEAHNPGVRAFHRESADGIFGPKENVPISSDYPAGVFFEAGVLAGGSGSDQLVGGPGNDIIGDVIHGFCTYGFLELAGSDVIHGGRGDDEVHSSEGAMTAFGGSGRDVLLGSDHDDILDGGPGRRDEAFAGDDDNGDRCPRVERRRDCEFH